ncbi:MAG: molybdopterin-dependent oxidoreductase [Chloroflexi bacterium]|jgi:sulfite dehydrogenase (quinone) subunit SoeA|nr:molybdopterin-dependent oxidoreductase [Chloroflexota bacterium]MBT5627279.1 molybdopterin-dependent oxidoreductase [Chloroflexota bacterium]
MLQSNKGTMMVLKVTRRDVLKVGAAAGALTAASSLFVGRMSTIRAVGAPKPDLQLTPVEEWVPTTCWIGKQDCGMLARKIDGRVVKFEGHPANPRNQGTLCPKGQGQIAALYDPNRVKTPLVRTNAKGVQGKFRSASWDEALGIVADRMNEVRKRDPRLLIWQKGRSKAKAFYDTAFVNASGATKLHHGAFCSDAGYRALEYTVGTHAVMNPDFKHTNYLISWGWNITNAGGNKTCWLTWNQQLGEAKKRGIKVTHIDPRQRPAGPHADEWVPIRPGTDLALALALCNLVIKSGTIDEPYLKEFTNSAYLVKEDGTYLRKGEGDEAKEQVWDQASIGPMDFGKYGNDPALTGEYTVDGEKVKPAYQMFKEHVAQYTAEWAADKCGVDVKQILQIAKDLADNANIGATHIVDGVEIPYRPVAIMTYHISQTELGFQQVRAQTMLMMLMGAMGAVGGTMSDFTWKIHKNFEGLDNISITDEPNIYLKNSKFYPINSNNSSVVAQVMTDPDPKANYGVDYTPEVCIIHMANPMTSFLSQKDIYDGYMKFKFVAVIDPWMSHTADLFADVVLPAATLEKYEGPISATDQYIGAQTLRVPPMDPLFESRGDIQIYLDLCEKAGILTGEGGYLDEINKKLKIDDANKIPIDRKPSGERELFDRWAKSEGYEKGVEFFETESVNITGPVSPTKRYGYVTEPPFGGAIHRLYGESLMGYQKQMKALGVEKIYYQDYTAFPTWRDLTMNSSPSEYDMNLISYHMIEFKQSRTSMISVLAELAPKQRADINPAKAKEMGFADGDEVIVESHNAVTGETRRITVPLHFTEALRPDTLAIPHHYGEIARHPNSTGQGDTPNALFFTGKGYTANTADQSFHVKVRLLKA